MTELTPVDNGMYVWQTQSKVATPSFMQLPAADTVGMMTETPGLLLAITSDHSCRSHRTQHET